MRISGHVVNSAEPAKNDVFENYAVRIQYLVLDTTAVARIFREQSQSFTLQGKDNGFHFDLPEAQALQEREDLAFTVLTPDGSTVLEQTVALSELVRRRGVIDLKVANVPQLTVKPPLPLRGRLVPKGGGEADFTGYKVVASYRARQSVGDDLVVMPDSQAAVLAGSTFGFDLPNADLLVGDVAVAAKYPDGTSAAARQLPVEALREEVRLEVELRAAPTITTDPAAEAAKPRKIKGKVVDLAGTHKVGNKQVILWGAHGEVMSPVLTAVTDANGNFYGDYPKGVFRHAMATVAETLTTFEHGAPVELVQKDAGEGREGGEFPDFVFVPVQFPADGEEPAESDCACGQVVPPRLPDQEELVANSSTYSQDIGLNCVNFTTPNRTLEEIGYTLAVRTTEPDIKGTTLSDQDHRRGFLNLFAQAKQELSLAGGPPQRALAMAGDPPAPLAANRTALSLSPAISAFKASSISSAQVVEAARATAVVDQFKSVPGRGALTASNSIDWDGTPTFYQATTIAHGHLLHFKQVWKADGYSMGDLIYSLPLAPGQKKQIVIFDWDRSEFGRRDESTHEDEALNAYLSHDRDVLDVVNTAVNESMRAGSSSRTSGSAGGIGGGIGALLGPVMIGVAGGYSSSSGSASSSAWQDSSRDLSGSALSQLRDSIQQASSAVRNQRSTVVQTARETERFRVETEVVANYNHCHAITIEYFEILRHYAIEQRLVDVQECLFVPLLMSEFDISKVVRWRDIIARALLVPRRPPSSLGTFLADPLARGLDAAQRIFMNYEGSDFPVGTYASESIVNLSGELRITFQLNRPRDADDDAEDPAKLDQLITLAALGAGSSWLIFAPLIGGLTYVHASFFANQKVRYKNKIFEERVAPVLAEAIVDRLVFTAVTSAGVRIPIAVDTTLVSDYRRDTELYVSVRPQLLSIRRDLIEYIEISTDVDVSQSEHSKVIVRSATFRYSTAHLNGYLARDYRVDNDLKPGDPVTLYTPLTAEEKRNPREEDKQYGKKLIEHLNANIEYYHKSIWMHMDQDRRYMLLDGFIAPNAGGRSVASVVENRVVGVAGNCLIMPVAPGYKLDPTYEFEPLLDDAGVPLRNDRGEIVFKTTDLLEHYRPRTPIPPYRVSVPTRGVFAEAVPGACNSCEKIERDRFWRWEESPIPDSPTQIAPIQTQPPQRTEPANLTPTAFPAPVVAFQNAPAAPEPGSAIAGALTLLGKPDLFRDITGLDQTQKNALQAMLSNQESAKHFADKAAELAVQASNLKHGDSTVDGIKRSINDGTLDKETGKKLIADVYRSQIDGGKPGPDPNTANNSELAKAAAKAVDAGRSVKAAQTHPDGTETTVEQTTGGAATPGAQPASASFDFTVPGPMPVIPQPDPKSCWAAIATMMVGWKTQSETTDIPSVLAKAGPEFVTAFQNKMGLGRADKLKLIAKLGMVPDEGNFQSHAFDYFLDELKTFGPLWMTVDTSATELALHAKILYGMRGDGTGAGTFMRVIDPNGGKRYEVTFEQFQQEYESVGGETPASDDLVVQIVRFPDSLGGGAGGATEGTGTAVLPFAASPFPTVGAPDTKLQAALEKAVHDAGAAGLLAPNPHVPFSLIALGTDGNHHYAGVQDGEVHYSASLLKVAALYAAHELLRAADDLARQGTYTNQGAFLADLAAKFNDQIKGAALASVRQAGIGLAPVYASILTASGFGASGGPTVDFTADFKTRMSQMIVQSDNGQAGACIRLLGYSYINAALIKAGFYDSGTSTGIWLAGDFSEGANPYVRIQSVNDNLVAQATTTREMSRLFALVQLGKLVDSANSTRMQTLLKQARAAERPWIIRSSVRKFDADLGKIGKGPLKNRKIVYSDGAVLRWNGDAAKLTAKKLTGEIAICWQNLHADEVNPPFDGVATVVNQAFTDYLA